MSVIEERGKRYGHFKDNANITQGCDEVFKEYAPNFRDMPNIHKEALHMIIQKLSRCACGDFMYKDNWVDIMGYAENVVKFLEEFE